MRKTEKQGHSGGYPCSSMSLLFLSALYRPEIYKTLWKILPPGRYDWDLWGHPLSSLSLLFLHALLPLEMLWKLWKTASGQVFPGRPSPRSWRWARFMSMEQNRVIDGHTENVRYFRKLVPPDRSLLFARGHMLYCFFTTVLLGFYHAGLTFGHFWGSRAATGRNHHSTAHFDCPTGLRPAVE